jgi:hypothetical protein
MAKQPIGYRSTVYGNESTPLIAVHELDDDEKLLNVLATRTREQIRELGSKKHKSGLKPTEIGKLAELEAVLDQVLSECRHRVFKDEAGFIYALRSCVTCGCHMGTV